MTIEVDGRTFTFVRPTLAFLRKFQVAKLEQFFSSLDFIKVAEQEDEYAAFVKKWEEFCGIAFEKDLKWRLGLTPKELNAERMPLTEMVRVVQSFFGYVGAGMK